MTCRKWLVRSLVFFVLGLAVLAALLYEAWTNPAALRRQLVAKLDTIFIGATVNVDSARLRLLGGLAVRDLRMARRDELDRSDFLYVPSAVLYHDKEHLLDGTLGFRKIELDRPRIRVIRERDGRINLAGLLAPPDLNERVPTLIIRRGTVVVEDRRSGSPTVLLEIKDVNLTVINDPLSTLVIEGNGLTDTLGKMIIHARFHRPTDASSAAVELPEVPVGPPLVQRLAGLCPDLALHIHELSGSAQVQAKLIYRPGTAEPLTYDVTLEMKKGELRHKCLPAPLQDLHASLRCINGRIPHAHLEGRLDEAKIELDLWDLVCRHPAPECIEDVVANMRAKVEHLVVTPQVFEHLPEKCRKFQRIYNPAGPITLTYQFYRPDAERWEKHWTLQPEGMTAEFEDFRYPIENVTGSLNVDLFSDRDDYIRVDLTGRGSDRLVTVRGFVQGNKSSEVDLVIAADDVPIDHKLMKALPEKSLDLARTFLPAGSRDLGKTKEALEWVQPAGLANIKVFVHRARGQQTFANRYLISFHDASLKYDLFPYPLEKVSGILDIHPDHWECRDVHGSHKGGEIWVNACSDRLDSSSSESRGGSANSDAQAASGHPVSSKRECVKIGIVGKDILLDPEFEQALSPPGVEGRAALRSAWAMLSLRGRLSFESVVLDRPDQPQDIDVAVDIKGCSMQPDFFRYAMTDVSAGVRYNRGLVLVKNVSAKHGSCRLGLKDATILLKPSGGFTAWFTDIRGDDLLPDEEFLRALHPALRRGLEPLQIRKPLQVKTKLTLDAPAVPGEPMKIWWDGGAFLNKQLFQAGVEISNVDGVIWCDGHHNGREFEEVKGRIMLDRATILGQPFTQLQGRIEVAPRSPDILSLYDLKANLFGGFVGGQGRFTFNSPLRYEVILHALNVQLEQFGKHNQLGSDAQLQGPVRASLHLTGEGTDLSGLKGNGRVEVARGKMYRLPLLLDLLKAFGLRMPDRTAFEQARLIFGIEGPQMRVHSLDLFGNAISLRGQGTLDLNGKNLKLDFSADWGRMPQLLPPGISDLSQAVSDQLFKIKMRGKISSPHFEKELIPGVVDPIKKVLGKP